MFRLITNKKTANLANDLTRGFLNANEIFICTAFLTPSGLAAIRDSLRKALRKGVDFEIIVGLDFHTTHPDALDELYELTERNEKKSARLFICDQSNSTFHPKLYFWQDSNKAHIVVGSANLTAGGLIQNIELSAMHSLSPRADMVLELRRFKKELHNNKRIRLATETRLSQYRRVWKIHKRAKQAAQVAAEKEIAKEIQFDLNLLDGFLVEYRADVGQNDEWARRIVNYKRAKAVLNKLTKHPTISGDAFLEEFEQLTQLPHHFWSSDGLFRQKNDLAKARKKLIQLIAFIQKNHLARNEQEMLNTTHEMTAEIPGLSWNVVSEILTTYAPKKFGVFNGNSTLSMKHIGLEHFKNPARAGVRKFIRFLKVAREISKDCGFSNLAEVDHFLNWIYQNKIKNK